jgi:Type II secretion system (T2SS), protein G
MEITIQTSEQDHKDFYKDYGFKRYWVQRLLILLVVDFLLSSFAPLLSVYLFNVVIYGTALFFILFIIPYLRAKNTFENIYDSLLLPNEHLIFKPFAAGIEVAEVNATTFLRYENIKTVGEAGRFIFILTNNANYYILPAGDFSSADVYNRFLRIVKAGVANAKGVAPSAPLTFKPVYLIGLLCFIPLIGAIVGLVLIILGVSHYKDKVFVIIGALGILFTVAIYSSLFYYTKNSNSFDSAFTQMEQMQINDLVKSIEFYKLQNGTYPDSLKQIQTQNSMTSIDDPALEFKNKKPTGYKYQRKGNKYLLFSVGKDGLENTQDDIYPTIYNADTTKLGFIKKMK